MQETLPKTYYAPVLHEVLRLQESIQHESCLQIPSDSASQSIGFLATGRIQVSSNSLVSDVAMAQVL